MTDDILKALYTTLTANSTLTTLVGHTSENKTIRSLESLKNYNFDMLACFGEVNLYKATNLKTRKVREITFRTKAFHKTDNIKCVQINEAMVDALDGQMLTITNTITSSEIDYMNTIPVYYDNELHMYVTTSRYQVIVKDIS